MREMARKVRAYMKAHPEFADNGAKMSLRE
jgi:hypothetical protein